MSTIERRFFAGDTLPQAVMAAARHFGLAPEEVSYRAVEKRHGFVRTRRRVLIEVDPAAPRQVRAPREASAPAPAPRVSPVRTEEEAAPATIGVTPAPPASEAPATAASVAAGEVERVAAVVEAVRRIAVVADLRVEPRVRMTESAVVVELVGEDQEVLAEDDGEVRGALEYLIPRAARGIVGEMINVRLGGDEGGEPDEEALRALALGAAVEVRRTGRAKTLQRMAPAARRVVHVTLADEPGVKTESEGEGFYKRVTIRPS